MRWEEQGTVAVGRYTVVPRSLSFICYEDELLLLRGAQDKRLWANRLNGIGGHIEPGEDPLSGALREIREEAGIEAQCLALRGVVHISGNQGDAGVLLFVFWGQAPSRELTPSREGTLAWHRLSELPWAEMVDDLPLLLPRVLARKSGEEPVYGLYSLGATGEMTFRFLN